MTSLSNGFVCIMGMGTVFICLILIVFICMAISAVIKTFSKAPQPTQPQKAAAPTLAPGEKSAVVAGVCACIAEELGTDASNIKVVSFKQV